MPCFYCGKRVSIVRQLTDADFCSDEHREKYHELTRMALNRLVESSEQAATPPRRQSKGYAAAVQEPPPARIERPEPAPPVQPEPQARPLRSRRPGPVVVVPPAPPPRPDPAIAEFAAIPIAEFSPESWPRFAGGEEISRFEIEIGRLNLKTQDSALRPADMIPVMPPAQPERGTVLPAPPAAFDPAPVLPTLGRLVGPQPNAIRQSLREARAGSEADIPESGFANRPPAPPSDRPRQVAWSRLDRAAPPPVAMPRLGTPPLAARLAASERTAAPKPASPQAARPAAIKVPLPPGAVRSGTPVLPKPGTAAPAAGRLPMASSAVLATRTAALQFEPTASGWSAYAIEPARALGALGPTGASRGLAGGGPHIPGMPAPAAPPHTLARPEEAAFAIPEPCRPQTPVQFHGRVPDTQPPAAVQPSPAKGTTPAPIAGAAVLPEREVGIPALEFQISAAPSLKPQGRGAPAAAGAPVPAAATRTEAAPFPIHTAQPRPQAMARSLAIPEAGFLPAADGASPRNVPLRPGEVSYTQFAGEKPSLPAHTQPRAPSGELAGAGAIPLAGRARPGAVRPSLPDTLVPASRAAKLPEPLSMAAPRFLPSAGGRELAVRPLTGKAPRQSAGWQAMPREGAAPGFDLLVSRFAAAAGAAITGGGLQQEHAPRTSAKTARPAAAPAVEMPVSIQALAMRLLEDSRTTVKVIRLAPMFRAARPARLPVFGRARIGKAGMPAAVFVPLESLEDQDDYSTMRMAPGAGPPPIRIFIPESKRPAGGAGKLATADLIVSEPAPAAGTARASAFGHRIPLVRPYLPDGWVDTVPADFDRVAAAGGQNRDSLVGAFKSASRFFRFM